MTTFRRWSLTPSRYVDGMLSSAGPHDVLGRNRIGFLSDGLERVSKGIETDSSLLVSNRLRNLPHGFKDCFVVLGSTRTESSGVR